jgi:hypothetical protein
MFNSVGLFFNQMVDLERIADLAQRGKIQWIAPIMHPDQSSVQLNRRDYKQWYDRLHPLGVKFAAWMVCDDPAKDIDAAEWIVQNYTTDALVLNCEKEYEEAGKWKGKVLCDGLMMQPSTMKLPKLLSYPSTPADHQNMDFRAFEKADCWFAPQAYWNDPLVPFATPKLLYDETYLPSQCHVGRDYRLWIYGKPGKPWGKVITKITDTTVQIQNLVNRERYNVAVVTKHDNGYEYMEFGPERGLNKLGSKLGKVLGFCAKNKIVPTVGIYDPKPAASQITAYLRQIPALKGASGYLGDTSENIHAEAIYDGVHR